jgi:hypothetical protein
MIKYGSETDLHSAPMIFKSGGSNMPAQTFAQRFVTSNPLPETPNSLVNEALAQLRVWFWELWQVKTLGAMWHCVEALGGCTRPKRGAVFTHQWESWQKDLTGEIDLFFEELFYMGRANVDCALPDPATWACNSLYQLIRENLVWPTSGEHLVDGWLKHACSRRPIRIWESPIGVGFYGVSASNEKIRDSDQIIPVLRQSFEQEILDHLFACHGGALLRLANDGWYPAAEDKPNVTLQDLKALPPRDGRLRWFVSAVAPNLQQEVRDVRSLARKLNAKKMNDEQKESFIETIRQKFLNLGDAEYASIKDLIWTNPGTSDRTAAAEIISASVGISANTAERYTRFFRDASSNLQESRGRWPIRLRLLHHEHVREYEELLVDRNKCA